MNNSCPFCSLPRERILHEREAAMAFRDGFPVSPGHTPEGSAYRMRAAQGPRYVSHSGAVGRIARFDMRVCVTPWMTGLSGCRAL